MSQIESLANSPDLGIKIGSKEEAYWSDMRDKALGIVEALEKELKLNKAILEMCDDKVTKERL